MWKKLPFKGLIYASFGINFLSAAIIFALRSFLPPVVPLFYGLPYGEMQLVPQLALLTVPVACLVLTLLNIGLSSYFKDVFYKKTLIISGVFVSMLGAITILKIVFLVGFF